jgi:hypothetical protein
MVSCLSWYVLVANEIESNNICIKIPLPTFLEIYILDIMYVHYVKPCYI